MAAGSTSLRYTSYVFQRCQINLKLKSYVVLKCIITLLDVLKLHNH